MATAKPCIKKDQVSMMLSLTQPATNRKGHFQHLLIALIGCFIGTIVGLLPGLGPINGVAILMPLGTLSRIEEIRPPYSQPM
jgi:TctA family transporter